MARRRIPEPPEPVGAPANGTPATNGDQDRLALNQLLFAEMVQNVSLSRADFISKLMDPRRDYDAECGYPSDPGPEDFQTLFDREVIPRRVVEALPKEAWQVQPSVYEDESTDTTTAFEDAWDGLGKQLRGEKSWYQDEKGSPVYEYLKRLNVLSRIGRYGVMLLGLDDGQNNLNVEAKPKKGMKLNFLRVFTEANAPVSDWVKDPSDRRFGQPLSYNLKMSDVSGATAGDGAALSSKSFKVHWTRVIHLPANLQTSEVLGDPEMRVCLNRLLDLKKLYGGSAEMYWRGAFPGYSLETNPALGGDVDVNTEDLRDMFEDWSQGLQRYLALIGMTAKSLSPQVVDPTPQINVHLEAICIALGMPMRIFKGSERGELASSQDDASWNDRLREYESSYITPRVIVPFVDRLIQLGVLPEPEGYSVWWPDLTSQSQQEKAEVLSKVVAALAAYVAGGVDALLPPMELFTRYLGMTDEEANSVLESAVKWQEEKATQQADQQQHESDLGLSPAPGAGPGPGQAGPGNGQPGGPPGTSQPGGGQPGFGRPGAPGDTTGAGLDLAGNNRLADWWVNAFRDPPIDESEEEEEDDDDFTEELLPTHNTNGHSGGWEYLP
jgi:hypothetical protein